MSYLNYIVILLLLTLQPSVNFINVLCTAFALVDPKSVRTQSSHQYLLTLFGSMSVKAVYRMLMKSTPGNVILHNGRINCSN